MWLLNIFSAIWAMQLISTILIIIIIIVVIYIYIYIYIYIQSPPKTEGVDYLRIEYIKNFI